MARPQPKKSAPPKKSRGGLIFVLFLFIALGGGAYYYYTEFMLKVPPAQVKVVKVSTPKPAPKKVEPMPTPTVEPDAPDVTAALAEAATLMEQHKWSEAGIKYAAIAALEVPEETITRAKNLAAAANLFADTVAKTKVSPEATAGNLYFVTLRSGAKFRGKLDEQQSTEAELVFLKDGGATQRIKKKEIVKQEEIDQETRDRQIIAELESRKKGARTPTDEFFCGEKALEFAKPQLAAEYFLAALEKDPQLAINVVEQQAAKLFALAAMERSLKKKSAEKKFKELAEKYGHTKVAQTADETLKAEAEMAEEMARRKAERKEQAKLAKAEKAETAAERKAARSKNSDLAEIEDEIAEVGKDLDGETDETKKDGGLGSADKLLADGKKLMNDAQNAKNRNETNDCYKKCVKIFTEAAAAYKKALDKKYDAKTEEKLEEATKSIYWCRKLQTL